MYQTVLIGLDGATFKVLDPLMDEGIMPFLKAFAQAGVRSELLSTPNPLTPPAWTSLMTGRSPGHHGIFDFVRVEERTGELYFTLNDSRDICCETIWSILSRHHRKVTSLNFPLMSPPEPLDGYMVPGLVSWKHLRRNVYPPDLYPRLQALAGFSPKEAAWDFDFERNALQVVPEERYEDWIRFHIRREKQWFEVVQYLMESDPSNLTAVLFDGPDKLQHLCWRFLDPDGLPTVPSTWEQKIRQLCLEYFRQLDEFIARICALAGSQARVFIVSDHGFGPTEKVFRVNTWLHQQGYLKWKSTQLVDELAKRSIEQRMNSDVALVDLHGTIAYGRTSASNGICIRVATDADRSGVPYDEYHDFRARLTSQLLDVRDPATGETVITRVLVREEAFPGEQSHRAPDLTLVLRDGGFVSILNKEPVVTIRSEVAGTHRPEGIFLGRGPGIRRGVNAPLQSIIDVPVAVLYSAGVPVPQDFEGQPPLEVFQPSCLEAYPLQIGEATRPRCGGDGRVTTSSARESAGDDKALVLRQMTYLGYIQ